MTVYYKATRLDGFDFYTGKTINYADAVGGRVAVPNRRGKAGCCTNSVLHASDMPTETLIGGSWPCRLFEVTGRPVAQKDHKFGFRSLRVVREVEAWQALGPQGREVAALVERATRLTLDEAERLAAAWYAARGAARYAAEDAAWYAAGGAARYVARDAAGHAAWGAAWYAVRGAAGGAARDVARDVARALVVRDRIGDRFTQAHYDTLTGPWATAIGPAHPEDVAA